MKNQIQQGVKRRRSVGDEKARKPRSKAWLAALFGSTALVSAEFVIANPDGASVIEGDITIAGLGTGQLNIQQHTDKGIVDWRSFDIDVGERTNFQQPGADAITLNRVVGGGESDILGNLTANGHVWLVNQNGIAFGPNARVDVAGLLATTADIDNRDFMEGLYEFSIPGIPGAAVTNAGQISVASQGLAALVAPGVENSGVISARLGHVELASAEGFTLDFYGDGRFNILLDQQVDVSPRVGENGSKSAINNTGELIAEGGTIVLSANVARAVVDSAINMEGIAQAHSIVESNGAIILEGGPNGAVTVSGDLDASGSASTGGTIRVSGQTVALGGLVKASGENGGVVEVTSDGTLSLAESVEARGQVGTGGIVQYTVDRIIETSTSRTNVEGNTDGGTIEVKATEHILSSGVYGADGASGRGGRVDITANEVNLLSTNISARGETRGGLVRIGGAFQGGQEIKSDLLQQSAHSSFVERWGDVPELTAATSTYANDGTLLDVSSSAGDGGTVVVWSGDQSTFLGTIEAGGPLSGGSVEISSKQGSLTTDLDRIRLGDGGELLLDPKNVVIGPTPFSLGVIGAGYGGSTPVSGSLVGRVILEPDDALGSAVALNAVGDRMAIGARGDDGANSIGSFRNLGAVYLLSFTDTNFSGGALEALVGSGYVGGKNINVSAPALDLFDGFGGAVSLNAVGDRLAVGAAGDDGVGNATGNAGAVHLFSFTDSSFSGGLQEGIVGKGYTTGKNVDVAALAFDDGFGSSVSLNAVGNRLVAGAAGDDGFGNAANNSGAAYLFSFSDSNFTSGALAGAHGVGYAGGNNLDITNLEAGDEFGAAVALNAPGNRLVIGATGDDGFNNAANIGGEAGAVYMLSFADTSFSTGQIEGIIGPGYNGGKNIDRFVEFEDNFGGAVALNAVGNLLAVGASGDDGGSPCATPPSCDYGAVHVFSFSDNTFSGGTLRFTFGRNFPSNNVDPELDLGDNFGGAVALNAAGNRVLVGATGDDGIADQTTDLGAAYFFGMSSSGLTPNPPPNTTFFSGNGLASALATGVNVNILASNDITVEEDIQVTGSPATVGALGLLAGRSIIQNADIKTLKGNVGLIANINEIPGLISIVDTEREPGPAVITMAPGTVIDAGVGNVGLAIERGVGQTNQESGDITISTIIANDRIRVLNDGPTPGSGVVLNGTLSVAGSEGIHIQGDRIINNAGPNALNPGNGRYLVWSESPANDALGGVTFDFTTFDTPGGLSAQLNSPTGNIFSSVEPSQSGNGLLYSSPAPELTQQFSLPPAVTVGLGQIDNVAKSVWAWISDTVKLGFLYESGDSNGAGQTNIIGSGIKIAPNANTDPIGTNQANKSRGLLTIKPVKRKHVEKEGGAITGVLTIEYDRRTIQLEANFNGKNEGSTSDNVKYQCVELIRRYGEEINAFDGSSELSLGDGRRNAENLALASDLFEYVANGGEEPPFVGSVISISQTGEEDFNEKTGEPYGHSGIVQRILDTKTGDPIEELNESIESFDVELFDQNFPRPVNEGEVPKWKTVRFSKDNSGMWKGTMTNNGIPREVMGWANLVNN